MRETETFDYIRQKYQSEKETWMLVRHLVKFGFKRHKIVLQTFNPCERRQYDTVDHINNRERFDNSIFNLRWADKRTQVENRRDKPGKKRHVCCIGDDEIYSSCAEVERLFGLPKNTVSKVCRGVLDNVDGYRFNFL